MTDHSTGEISDFGRKAITSRVARDIFTAAQYVDTSDDFDVTGRARTLAVHLGLDFDALVADAIAARTAFVVLPKYQSGDTV